MATVLGLAMRITADASGLSKSLTPVDRALQQLGQQADKSADLFDRFKDSTTGAADAQQNVQRQFAELTESLRSGVINAEEFATQFAAIQQSARETADAFARGAAVTEQAKTAEERRAEQLAELNRLLELGAISQETFRRSVDEVSGANAAALESERNRVAEQTRLQQQADRLTDQYRTDSERRLSAIEQLEEAFLAGRVTSETYERAIRDLNGTNAAAAQAERDRQQALAEGLRLTQQFATAEERRAAELARVQSLFSQGAVDAETFGRAISAAFNIDPAASEAVASSVQGIVESVAEGRGSIEEYADTLASLAAEQQATAEAERQRQQLLEEGKRVSEQVATADEKRAAELQNLERLLQAGAISQETFARAAADASGSNAAAAEAERERASAIAEANRIIQANLTPQERYDAQIVELEKHLDEGRLSQDQFNRAQARAKSGLDQSSKSAERADESLQGISRQLRLISTLEVGRALVDSFQLLTSAVRAVTTQITSAVSSVTQSLDAIDKLSIRTGVAREALQGYGVAAELAGVSVDQFGQTVQRLAVAIGRATPTAELLGGLDQLGVSLDEIRRLSPEQQFALLAERISALPTAAQRAGAAFAVFGEQGVALAPLFEQAGDSLEGLRQRAERLGIIVSDDQIAAITEMNDTFTLVRRTVEGIIGQVTGNLAPVVTAISEEFLNFVESFQGVGGEGGGGIANAITDVLLDGAEVLASVFDSFVSQFSSFEDGLESAGDVFQRVGDGFRVVAELLRTVFNTFQIAGNALALGLGKIVEAIGGYLDSDLEAFGRDMAAAASASMDQNIQDLQDAAQGVVEATANVVGGRDAEQAGDGQGVQFIQGLRQRIERERLPAVRLEADIEDTREAFDDLFGGLVDQSSRVTGLMREFEAALAAAREDGELTADEIERLNKLQEGVNTAIRQELALRAEAKAEAQKQAAEDAKRIESLLQVNDAAAKVEQDILAVRREQQRLSESIAAGTGDATAQQQRLAELEQLEARLEDQQQAIEQGFGEGFQAAFAAVNQDVNDLIDRAAQFGNEGAAAAQRLQEGIAAAQQQARDGILNAEAFNAEVQRQQQLFEGELERIQQAEDFRRQLQDEALAAEKERREAILEAQKAAQEEQEKIAEAAAERQRQIFAEQRKAAEAEAKRQEQRIRALNTLGVQTIQSGDIRTAEGAALVQRLAAEAQDPALIEQRRQTKLLQQISAGIAGAAANYFDSPVEIVGFARIGGIP